MKQLVLILLVFVAISSLQAQKIKFKKGIVYVDGVSCLNYDSSDPNNIAISNLDESQTIYLKFIRPYAGNDDGLYTKIIFVEQKKSFTSKSYIFSKKLLVKKLLKDNLIKDCIFDASKIDKFIMRYDEDIEKTILFGF